MVESLHQFDFTGPLGLVEPRIERAVETQDREPAPCPRGSRTDAKSHSTPQRRFNDRRRRPRLLDDLGARHVRPQHQKKRTALGTGQPVGLFVLSRRDALNVDGQAAVGILFQSLAAIA